MTSSNRYQPSDEFREHLEWEVLRRHRRNVRERANARSYRFAKAAAVVVVSASIGATAGFASAQVRQGGARDSLLAAAQADAALATARYDIAKAESDDLSIRVRATGGDQVQLADAAAELRDMEARRNAAGLNIEEINASGQAPRDDLGAPLVAGHDYVKQRIALQLGAVQARLEAAEAAQALADRRNRAGAGDDVDVANAQLKVVHVQGNLAVLAEQMRLREEFLARGTSPTLLAQRLETTQLRADASYDQAELTVARSRLAAVEKKRSFGVASEVDLLRAQWAVKELEMELQRLGARLQGAGAK